MLILVSYDIEYMVVSAERFHGYREAVHRWWVAYVCIDKIVVPRK